MCTRNPRSSQGISNTRGGSFNLPVHIDAPIGPSGTSGPKGPFLLTNSTVVAGISAPVLVDCI